MDLSDEAEAVMVNLEQAVEADAALQAAETEWSLCMRAEGYEVDLQSELVGLVEEWLLPVLARAGSKEVVVRDPQGGSITVIVPDIDRSDLAEVQRREIELALTDRRCDSSTGLSDTRARVRLDLQNRAISQYYDELRGSSDED